MIRAPRRCVSILLITAALPSLLRASDDVAPLQIFEERILPIFKSPEPSSCVQCHLSSVDLKDYILPSHEKTFVSLRDQGLIDLGQARGLEDPPAHRDGRGRPRREGPPHSRVDAKGRVQRVPSLDHRFGGRSQAASSARAPRSRAFWAEGSRLSDSPRAPQPRARIIHTPSLVAANAMFPVSHAARTGRDQSETQACDREGQEVSR